MELKTNDIMKKIRKPLLFSLILLGFMAIARISPAQAPPPPPADKGSNDNKAPMGAPVEGGIVVTISLIAAFGAWKMLKAVQKKRETAENGKV